MKGHVRLAGQDLALARAKGDGFQYKEGHTIPEELEAIFLQAGCFKFGQQRLLMAQNDFSGGDQQVTYANRNMVNATNGVTLYGTRLPGYDQRMFGQTVLSMPMITLFKGQPLDDYIIPVGIYHHNGSGYMLSRAGELYSLSSGAKILDSLAAVYEYNGEIYYIDTAGNFSGLSDATDYSTGWSTLPQFAVYAKPHLYTFEHGNIRIFSHRLMTGPLSLRLSKTDGNVAEVRDVYAPETNYGTATLTPSPNTSNVHSVLSAPENGKPDLFNVISIGTVDTPADAADCIVIKCVTNTAIQRGYDKYKSATMSRYMKAVLGYERYVRMDFFNDKLYKRLNRPSDIDPNIGWLLTGQYDESPDPTGADIEDDFYKMALPIERTFKISWLSGRGNSAYYQFHSGECVDLGYTGISVNTEQLAIEVASLFDDNDSIEPGDTWYIPVYPAGTYGTGSLTLPTNIIPGTVTVTSTKQAQVLRNTVVLGQSPTDATYTIKQSDIDARYPSAITRGTDWLYSHNSGRFQIIEPIYGGGVSATQGLLAIRYRTYNRNAIIPDFLPDEFTNRRMYYDAVIKTIKGREDDGYQIVTNSEKHLFVKDLTNQNPNTPAIATRPNCSIVQNEDDYIMSDAYLGTIKNARPVGGRILFVTYESTEGLARAYLCDRSGVAVLGTILCDDVFDIAALGDIVLVTYKADSQVKCMSMPQNPVFSTCALNTAPSYGILIERNTDMLLMTDKQAVSVSADGTYVEKTITVQDDYFSFRAYEDETYYCQYSKYSKILPATESSTNKIEFNSCLYRFGNDAGIKKILVGIKVDCSERTKVATGLKIKKESETSFDASPSFTYDDVTDMFTPDTAVTFRQLQLQLSADLEWLSSVGIVFELAPESMEHKYMFVASINKQVKFMLQDGETAPTMNYGTIKDIIDVSGETTFTDMEGVNHTVVVKSIEVTGQPGVSKATQVTVGATEYPDTDNSYTAVFVLTEVI